MPLTRHDEIPIVACRFVFRFFVAFRRNVQSNDRAALADLVADTNKNFRDFSLLRRRHIHRRLVAFERDQRIVDFHFVARLHLNFDNRHVVEITDVGHLDVYERHFIRLSVSCGPGSACRDRSDTCVALQSP